MQRWKIAGIIATLIIVISLPLYGLKQYKKRNTAEETVAASFFRSESCAKCHKKEYDEWQESHHAKAMAVANEETVLAFKMDNKSSFQIIKHITE